LLRVVGVDWLDLETVVLAVLPLEMREGEVHPLGAILPVDPALASLT
jgi:hypothetical protein